MLKLAKEANRWQHPDFFLFTHPIHHYFYFLSQLYAYQKRIIDTTVNLPWLFFFLLFALVQFDYLIPPIGMDKCSVNSVDIGNVHKAGMVMNGLPISVYTSETLRCAAAMSIDG
jgi:hypothetical protein